MPEPSASSTKPKRGRNRMGLRLGEIEDASYAAHETRPIQMAKGQRGSTSQLIPVRPQVAAQSAA